MSEPSQLVRIEFTRDMLRVTDNPIQFVAHEITSIFERMPEDLRVDVMTASKVVVTVTTE